MLPFVFLTLLATISASTTTIEGVFSNTQHGKGTYYTYPTGSSGACNFGTHHPSFVVANNLWRAALATPQFYGDDNADHSLSCGMCIEVSGYTSSPVMAFVDNVCPNGCSAGPGSIDMGAIAALGGRYDIQWKGVPCPVGSVKIQYKIGSNANPTWVPVLPIGNSVPIVKLEFKIGTSWVALKNSNYGYWSFSGGTINAKNNLPLHIRLTSYKGEVLTDTIAADVWESHVDVTFALAATVVVPGSGVQFSDVTTSFHQPPVAPSFLLPQIVEDSVSVGDPENSQKAVGDGDGDGDGDVGVTTQSVTTQSVTTSSSESGTGLIMAMLTGVGVLAVVVVMLAVVVVVIVMKRS